LRDHAEFLVLMFQTNFFTDTSRHYLPVPVIKGVIDSMTFSKLVRFRVSTRRPNFIN
jgi:hypothetical protein